MSTFTKKIVRSAEEELEESNLSPVSVIKAIECNIRAYNKYMTKEYLDSLNILSMLRNVHPGDRRDFAIQAAKARLVTTAEIGEYLLK